MRKVTERLTKAFGYNTAEKILWRSAADFFTQYYTEGVCK